MKLDCRKCEEKNESGFCTETLWEIDGQQSSGCPVRRITKSSFDYIQAFTYLENGYGWPNSGGWQDQPAKFLDAVNVIKAAIQRLQEEREKSQKRSESYGQ